MIATNISTLKDGVLVLRTKENQLLYCNIKTLILAVLHDVYGESEMSISARADKPTEFIPAAFDIDENEIKILLEQG